jgi:hypothetical protein
LVAERITIGMTGDDVSRVAFIDEVPARERITEICEILALGLIRLNARKSSQFSAATGESSLDCLAHQSGHVDGVLHAEPRS